MASAKIADSTTVAIDSLKLWDRNPRSIKGRYNAGVITEQEFQLMNRLSKQLWGVELEHVSV